MESGRPRADFWCERTDAEYIRHMHTKHKLWLWKEVSKAEQITCGSTQTYEHNTYSPLRKSTLQQSKQEAKVSNDQTAPVCCSQPSENTDRSNSLKCTYYLNCPEDCASSANWGCLQWRLQMSAIRWIPWTELPFQRMHTARKKKLNVCTEQRSPLLHLSRRGDTVHKSNIKPPRYIWNQCTGCHFGLH